MGRYLREAYLIGIVFLATIAASPSPTEATIQLAVPTCRQTAAASFVQPLKHGGANARTAVGFPAIKPLFCWVDLISQTNPASYGDAGKRHRRPHKVVT